jgi:DNA-binding NarL/FixJ family response regulator
MGALRPGRRQGTAKELAALYGVTPRTIQRAMAEPREEFEARAAARQDEALRLIESGLTYRQVAERMGTTRGTAAGLVHRARQRRARYGENAA